MTTYSEARERLASHLREAGSRNVSGDDWLCPVHELDGKCHAPSLTVKRGDEPGVIVVKCAKCETAEVLTAIGLTFADLHHDDTAPPRPVGKPEIHDYPDADGENYLRVVRQRMTEGRPQIRQRHWNGKTWKSGTVKRQTVLYNLPRVLKAARKGREVHLTEGESDADALNRWFKDSGVKKAFATTHPGGAGKWRDHYTDALAGAALLVVWADRDAPGYTCAAQRFSALQRAGYDVEIRLPIPDQAKADVRDHLAEGHTPADGKVVTLGELQAATPQDDAALSREVERELQRLRDRDLATRLFRAEKVAERHARSTKARSMSGGEFFMDLPAETPTLWGDGKRILWIDGEPLLICGDDGTGKSTLDHQLIAARLGFRDDLLGYSVQPALGRILYLAMDRPEQARRAGNRLFPDDVGVDFRSALTDNLVVWRGPLPIDVLSAPETLADWIYSEFGPVVEVHADSLKDVAARLSDDAVGSGINSAIQEVVSRGTNWVGLHHQRKASGENRKAYSLSDVYGSRWLTAGQGSVLMLVKAGENDKDQVEMRQLKEPSDRVPPLLLEHDRSRGRTQVVEASQDPEQILRAAGEAGATAMQVAAAMFSKAAKDVSPGEKKRADRQLARLVKNDEVTRVDARKGGDGGTSPARFIIAEGADSA